jgi:putative ABC transport system permease protein
MTRLAQDLLYAIRSFRRTPVFTGVAVLSLALGIGANTAIFTLVDQLILRLLPVRDPEQIVILSGQGRHYGGNNGRNALSYRMYQDLRDRNTVFSAMMCRYRLSTLIGAGGEAEASVGELVSGNYFPMLGVHAAVGRLFTASDDLHAGAHPYAVLSYSYWQTRFAGDRGILGQTIRVNNYPLTVVGVAQPGFEGLEPGLPARVFIPVSMAVEVRPGFRSMWDRRQRWVNVYGRLRPGMTVQQAQAGLQPLFHQIIDGEVIMPAFRNATPFDKAQFLKMWLQVAPGGQGNTNLRRQYEKPLLVLMGLTGFVLLIACANLASLLTARAAARQREVAIRLAMGASRARMIRQLLTESTLLSVAGGVAGILLAVVMARGLLAFLPAGLVGYSIAASPDGRMLGFTCALALVTGIGFGLAPALQSTKPDIAPTLKAQAGNVAGGAGVGLRKILVAAQVTLSLLLLIGAGMFARSLANLRQLNPGFQTGNLIEFNIAPAATGYDIPRSRAFFRRTRERLLAIPGVRDVGYANVAVLSGNEWDNGITIEGYQAKVGEDMDPHFNSASPGYDKALGLHVLAGRWFTDRDLADAPRVAVVNESLARHYFGDNRAVGRRLGLGTDPGTPIDTEIIGVVNDTRYEGLRDDIPRLVYVAAQQAPQGSQWFYVRTERDPESTMSAVRAALRELEPNLPVTYFKTLERQLEESLVTERMIATLSTGFGALATLLAVIGLYGVMAFLVTRRAREIGIRMALGALPGNVLWLVMREVLALVAAGILVGAPAAIALAWLVRSQLYGVEPADPLSVALGIGLLAAVSLLAGYVPARRAANYDPVRVLRYE